MPPKSFAQTDKKVPIMATATAVWLVDNTALTFKQIAQFCDLHDIEVEGIADGYVATNVKGFNPITADQLEADEIKRGEADPNYQLQLKSSPHDALAARPRPREQRYTPLSKRQERPAAILWLVRKHPEIPDADIAKLVGTTKPTIKAIRERTHWNMSRIEPIDPVALGFCKQYELDAVVQKNAPPEAETTVAKDTHSATESTEGTEGKQTITSLAGLNALNE